MYFLNDAVVNDSQVIMDQPALHQLEKWIIANQASTHCPVMH